MKNFGSILAFFALSAGVVSARALPEVDSISVRAPYNDISTLFSRSPKKDKAGAGMNYRKC